VSTSSHDEPGPAYRGVVLAGPPASGRRTTAFALTSLRRSYAHYPALTPARQALVDAAQATRRQLDELRSWAQLFAESTCDGVGYAYDRERLNKLRDQGRIPVACVDDVDVLRAFEQEADDWLPVLLWCPREEAERRLADARDVHATPVSAWLRRWDRSTKKLLREPLRFPLSIRTDRMDPVHVAQIVHLAAQSGAAAGATASRARLS
jgi:hypothetical protein